MSPWVAVGAMVLWLIVYYGARALRASWVQWTRDLRSWEEL